MNISKYLFSSYHYHIAVARPRVHGGYAIMMDRVIITCNLDEVLVTFSRFPKNPHKFRLHS